MTWYQCGSCGFRVWTPGYGTDAYRARYCAACGRRHDPASWKQYVLGRTDLFEMEAPDAE